LYRNIIIAVNVIAFYSGLQLESKTLGQPLDNQGKEAKAKGLIEGQWVV